MNQINLMAQQGWQCPLCYRVYSPTTPMCFTCNQPTKATIQSPPVPPESFTQEEVRQVIKKIRGKK